MGGLLTKCVCTSASEPPDNVVDETEDSTITISEQNNAYEDQQLQLQQKLRSENPGKYFYRISLVETLNSFRRQKLFADFTVNVGGNHFAVHKNVLAASCVFFRELFDASEDTCYEMTNVEPDALEDVLNFLYTGKCRLDQQNAASVLCAAHMLGLHDLQEASEICLSSTEDERICPQEEFFASQEGSILTAIREFQVVGLFCDVTLRTSCGRVVPVHKNILAAVSCYFQGLFRSDMREAHENNVDFGIVDESVVNDLLTFIYSGEISITFDNVRSLFQASDYLLIESLQTTIDKFLKGPLTVSNFWQLFALAKYFDGLTEITKDISQMTIGNYWEITKSDEFLEITESDMRMFLSNDDIVSSEAQMLESLIRWYKYSKQQREESFKSLLHLIHVSSIPELYLKFLAEKEGVDELLSYTGHQLRAEVSLDEIKRTAHFYNLALFGITLDHHYSCSYVCYWLPFAGPWSFITSMQHPTLFCRSSPLVFNGDAVYLHVYTYDRVQLAFLSNPLSCRHFHPSASDSQTLAEPVPTAIEDSITIALSSHIYFLGGNIRDEIIDTVQRYNTKTQSWECVSSMQERRYNHFAVNYKDRCIYVFGGIDRVSHRCVYKSTVERYDPVENSWSYVASMHQPRCDGLACVLTHKIFVIGGRSAPESSSAPKCEIYDPLTDEWQMGSFQLNEIYTLKPSKGLKDAGTYCNKMLCCDDTNGDNTDVNLTSESDPLGLKVCLPHDEKCYDHSYVYTPSVTHCNGVTIVFHCSAFSKRNTRTLKLPFYFVDLETGNFRILYSLPSWPESVSQGIMMPLSRRDMIKALKDYPGNKS